MIIPKLPQSNQPISADWGRGVVEALRRLRPSSGPGILVNQTPEGTTYSLAPKPPVKPGVGTAGSDGVKPVPCRIISGSPVSGFSVEVYGNGMGTQYTSMGTLRILEISATATLKAGSWVLGLPYVTLVTGGSE